MTKTGRRGEGRAFSWLRRPAVHFALLGTGLFVLNGALGPDAPGEQATSRAPIVITAERIEMLRNELRRHGAEPGPAELRARIRIEVDEEILYREARLLALDFGDASVRRRLLQKMRALNDRPGRSEDELVREARELGLDDDAVIRRLLIEKMRIVLSDAGRVEPVSDDELHEVLVRHYARFAHTARVTLTQIFLGGEDRAELEARAEALHREIAGRSPSGLNLRDLGDSFPLGRWLRNQSRERILGRFGEAFADAVVALEPRRWSEPIESPYGLHLIWVEERIAERLPPLNDVRRAVMITLAKERQAAQLERTMLRLRNEYGIRVEAGDVELLAEDRLVPTPST